MQARRAVGDEPAQIRKVRRHGRFDLFERRHCLPQFERKIRQLVHLHLLRSLLRDHQSLQTSAIVHNEDGRLLPRQEEERSATTFVFGSR